MLKRKCGNTSPTEVQDFDGINGGIEQSVRRTFFTTPENTATPRQNKKDINELSYLLPTCYICPIRAALPQYIRNTIIMSVNKVILLGNVATDPEVRYLEQNLPVASFRLATTERGRQNADGNRTPDRTEFHTIVAWRGLAEIAEKYIRKGSPIYVEGKLRTRQYNATDGSQRSVTEIVADSIELLGSRRSDSQQ